MRHGSTLLSELHGVGSARGFVHSQCHFAVTKAIITKSEAELQLIAMFPNDDSRQCKE